MSLHDFLRARPTRPNPGPYRVEWCDADAVADPPVDWHLLGAPILPDEARALAAAAPDRLGRPAVLLRILGGGDPEKAPLMAALDRAIAYCEQTLAFGKAQEPLPDRRVVDVANAEAMMAGVERRN